MPYYMITCRASTTFGVRVLAKNKAAAEKLVRSGDENVGEQMEWNVSETRPYEFEYEFDYKTLEKDDDQDPDPWTEGGF
jgi:hypothetical protein